MHEASIVAITGDKQVVKIRLNIYIRHLGSTDLCAEDDFHFYEAATPGIQFEVDKEGREIVDVVKAT